jgi:hypothetical protein
MATGQGDLGGTHVSEGGADPAAQIEDLHVGRDVPRRGAQPTVPSVVEPMLGGAAGDHVLQSQGAQLVEIRDSGRGDASHTVHDASRARP